MCKSHGTNRDSLIGNNYGNTKKREHLIQWGLTEIVQIFLFFFFFLVLLVTWKRGHVAANMRNEKLSFKSFILFFHYSSLSLTHSLSFSLEKMTEAREEMMPLNEIGKRVAHVVNAKWAVTLWHRPRITGHSGNPLDTLLAPFSTRTYSNCRHFLSVLFTFFNSNCGHD